MPNNRELRILSETYETETYVEMVKVMSALERARQKILNGVAGSAQQCIEEALVDIKPLVKQHPDIDQV